MPTIQPTSVEDLLSFIKKHHTQIEDGTYTVVILNDWVPEIPENVAILLAKQKTWMDTVLILAEHQHTPSSVLEFLGKHESAYIRGRVAEHPNTPTSVLDILSRDKYSYPYTLDGIHGSKRPIRSAVAGNQSTSLEVLEILLSDSESGVRSSAARNSNIPLASLERLAGNSDLALRWGVASNPRTPPAVLESLAHDSSQYVCLSVAKNPNAPPQLRRSAEKRAERLRKGGRCFVATAVYGDDDAPQVDMLRDFRDRWLLQRRWGRHAVTTYYAVSPPLARLIGKSAWAKRIVRRHLLDPIVRVIRKRSSG